MPRRFQTKATLTIGLLTAMTVTAMTFLLIVASSGFIGRHYRERGRLLTMMARRNVQFGRQLPAMVMDCVADQMVVSALLTAELVALAEQSPEVTDEDVEAILRDVIRRSKAAHGSPLVDEFWVTDETGRAVIATEDIEFTFVPEEEGQTQAGAFYRLLREAREGRDPIKPVVQELGPRSYDGREVKYVGVAGVDKPRIVQVGARAELVRGIEARFSVQRVLEQFLQDTAVERIIVFGEDGRAVAAANQAGAPPETVTDVNVAEFAREYLDNSGQTQPAFRGFGSNIGVISQLTVADGRPSGALFIEHQSEEAINVLRKSLIHIALLGLALMCAGVAASYFLSRGLAKPVARLAAGVEAFGKGHLDQRVDVGTHDELQGLATTFNTMADSMRGYVRQLEMETQRRERLESELRIAADLQNSLLPERPPYVPGLDMAGWSRPARQVGGDFYDYVPLTEGRLGVAIGDATGHGLPAALLIADCWSVFRALADGDVPSPAAILFQTNRALCRRLGDSGRFVTMFFMVIDPAQRLLRYSVAGHNPPILAGPGREPFHLTSRHGFPLGVVPGAEFQDTQVELRPGDTTLLYSDGLTEAMGKDGSRYGEARLCEQLRRRIAEPPVGILDDLRRDFEAFSGQSEQEDDVTLVAARLREDV